MWPFKRKTKKFIHHELKWVGFTRTQTNFMRAVECRNCGKQFIMDVFGGWAIEWKFRELGKFESLSKDDLLQAIDDYHKAYRKSGTSGWVQLGFDDVCEATKV